MTTIVSSHTHGSLIKTYIETETHDELVELARRNERSLAGELRILIRQHVSDNRAIDSRATAGRAPWKNEKARR